MDLVSSLLSALLFVVFIPGVLVTLPSKTASRRTVLLVHTALFAVVTTLVMRFYWHNIKGYIETFGNFGPVCPNGYAPGTDPTGIDKGDCIPVGHPTYTTDGRVPEPSESSP
jgi:hypothetical protein